MVYKQKGTKNKLSISKKALLLSTVVLLLIGGFFVYRHFSAKPQSNTPVSGTQSAEQKINYSPPTKQDMQDVDQHKDDISKNNQFNSSQNTSQKTVSIVVVDAAQYDQQVEVRAFVSGVIENGGVCTYTFTNNSTKLTKQTKAVADATTTRCPTLDVPRSEFTAGNWSVTITYASSTSQGSSQAKSFEVK